MKGHNLSNLSMFNPIYIYIYILIGNGYFAYYKPNYVGEVTALISSYQSTSRRSSWWWYSYTEYPHQCLTFWISMYSVQITQIGDINVCVYPGMPTSYGWNVHSCTSVFAKSGQQTSSSTTWREVNVDIDLDRKPTSVFSTFSPRYYYIERFPYYRVLYLLLRKYLCENVTPLPLIKDESS